jgi:hypothetical protein
MALQSCGRPMLQRRVAGSHSTHAPVTHTGVVPLQGASSAQEPNSLHVCGRPMIEQRFAPGLQLTHLPSKQAFKAPLHCPLTH